MADVPSYHERSEASYPGPGHRPWLILGAAFGLAGPTVFLRDARPPWPLAGAGLAAFGLLLAASVLFDLLAVPLGNLSRKAFGRPARLLGYSIEERNLVLHYSARPRRTLPLNNYLGWLRLCSGEFLLISAPWRDPRLPLRCGISVKDGKVLAALLARHSPQLVEKDLFRRLGDLRWTVGTSLLALWGIIMWAVRRDATLEAAAGGAACALVGMALGLMLNDPTFFSRRRYRRADARPALDPPLVAHSTASTSAMFATVRGHPFFRRRQRLLLFLAVLGAASVWVLSMSPHYRVVVLAALLALMLGCLLLLLLLVILVETCGRLTRQRMRAAPSELVGFVIDGHDLVLRFRDWPDRRLSLDACHGWLHLAPGLFRIVHRGRPWHAAGGRPLMLPVEDDAGFRRALATVLPEVRERRGIGVLESACHLVALAVGAGGAFVLAQRVERGAVMICASRQAANTAAGVTALVSLVALLFMLAKCSASLSRRLKGLRYPVKAGPRTISA
jgi:hypothetical protein